MSKESWLISWVGKADHDCAEGARGSDLGPVASAVKTHAPFDKIYLLTNYEFDRTEAYCAWLEKTTGCVETDLFGVELSSPTNYAEIYEQVSRELKALRLPNDDIELTFHLSPGTPAMTAIWIILAKTRFPAKLIQTSKESGLESVDFIFDLANEYLPEFLQRSSERIERLSSAIPTAPEFSKLIHRSPVMREQIQLAQRIAAHEVPVLILGETGTGKELFAEAIHAASSRTGKPFIAVNCGAMPKDLANSDLFGHKKGAFTGADSARPGHFREAEGGTLFLDEIGDLPLDSQVRLLRALQQREITPLGESKPVKVNVRIIAATHRDLAKDVAEGCFREDLFHRLAVGILNLPPLRERDGDLDLLIDHWLDQINRDTTEKPEAQHKKLSLAARNLLLAHGWPGNIRELYHTLLRAAIWSSSATIEATDIQRSLLDIRKNDEGLLDRSLGKGFDLQELLDEISRHYIGRALQKSGNKKKLAAELLGFSNYQTLSNWAGRLGVGLDEKG
ncbi:sigma-54 interaction domain-containing protein [Fluviibacter phosphoraccumulans]|uniref:sigma-54 interaction domain-containing protein n=1 Tax=Fluviibacter phosphoraccumulans TaxID=1751046 RepID=UPI0024E26127|nr:sigma 54-interacting transcriptional regulator [Fluviibacter phosphoraccumulans]